MFASLRDKNCLQNDCCFENITCWVSFHTSTSTAFLLPSPDSGGHGSSRHARTTPAPTWPSPRTWCPAEIDRSTTEKRVFIPPPPNAISLAQKRIFVGQVNRTAEQLQKELSSFLSNVTLRAHCRKIRSVFAYLHERASKFSALSRYQNSLALFFFLDRFTFRSH